MKQCKVILLGDSCVGKTTLIHRYISGEYRNDFKATLGTNITTKIYTKDDKDIEAAIWDTAGTERFKSISSIHYRDADACILVFDYTSLETFHNLSNWRQDVLSSAGIKNLNSFPFIVAGNKCDSQFDRQIEEYMVKEWCDNNNMKFFSVSAKTGENVNELFNTAIESCLFKKNSPPPQKIDIQDNKKRFCC